MGANEVEKKNRISIGLIVSREDLDKNPLFPADVIKEIQEMPYYLLIFVAREDVVKISCLPSQTNNIKKILIKLMEFSPDLVKGISSILNELNLSKNILHTTGLCYEMEKCFYETYLNWEKVKSNKVSVDTINKKFMALSKVLSVNIEDIPLFSTN